MSSPGSASLQLALPLRRCYLLYFAALCRRALTLYTLKWYLRTQPIAVAKLCSYPIWRRHASFFDWQQLARLVMQSGSVACEPGRDIRFRGALFAAGEHSRNLSTLTVQHPMALHVIQEGMSQ